LSIFEQNYPSSSLTVERKEPTKERKRAFHKYCIFVKNSVYCQYPLLLLLNHVLHMKQRSKSISIAGSVGTYTAWHLHPFLSR